MYGCSLDYGEDKVMFKDSPNVWHELPTTNKGLVMIPLTKDACERRAKSPPPPQPPAKRIRKKRIYISLPDATARAGIMKNKGGKTKNTVTDEEWVELGNASEGYSGSDIAIVVNEALMMPVRRCQTAKRFKSTPEGGLIPTFPSDPEGQNMTLMDVDPTKLVCPPVTMDDFMSALSRIRPSVCDKDIEDHI